MSQYRLRYFSSAFLFFFLLVRFASAQEKKDTSIIDIRHRLLLFKKDDDRADIAQVDSFRKIHLMIAGNVYQTEKHVRYAYDEATNKYNFFNELKYIQPILNLGDVTIANLKTSFANDAANMFSSPDEFALALKYAGINAVMHANVHTANIDLNALNRTRETLNSYDILHTGAFADMMERNGNYPLIINKKGFRIAVLNYTTLSNRPEVSSKFIINAPDKNMIERDMRMAHANKPDFTIVYFDWGISKDTIPSLWQMDLAKFAFQKGADLVVGTQPNIPMRIDYVSYSDNGVYKEGIVAYSLGNLIASNEEIRNRNGYIIDMELKKNNYTNITSINDWGVVPVYTYYDTLSVKGKTTVLALPCSNVENADILANLPYIEKRRAVNSAYEVRKLLGSTADEIQYNLTELAVNNVEETINLTNAPLNNKFSLKRKGDVVTGEAPLLLVADTAPTPSLAMLYDEPQRTAMRKEIPPPATNKKVDKARTKAQEIFDVKPIEIATQSTASISTNLKEEIQPNIEPITGKDLTIALDTFYRIQFYALAKPIPLDTNYYVHLKGYEVLYEDSMYKYLLGKYTNYNDCYNYWKSQIQPRYKGSFVVKYVSGKRILK